MELIDPKTSSSENVNPVIRVKDKKPGDWVELFTDSECKNNVAGGPVPEGSTSIDLTVCGIVTFLDGYLHHPCHQDRLTPGDYKFYEKSLNENGSSDCSNEYVEYFLTPDPRSPSEPEALSVQPPTDPRSINLYYPLIRVLGVIPGNKVTLHLDKFCNDIYHKGSPLKEPIGSNTVEEGESHTHIEMHFGSITHLRNTPGSYPIYAKAGNFYGWSRCSKASVTHVLQ